MCAVEEMVDPDQEGEDNRVEPEFVRLENENRAPSMARCSHGVSLFFVSFAVNINMLYHAYDGGHFQKIVHP